MVGLRPKRLVPPYITGRRRDHHPARPVGDSTRSQSARLAATRSLRNGSLHLGSEPLGIRPPCCTVSCRSPTAVMWETPLEHVGLTSNARRNLANGGSVTVGECRRFEQAGFRAEAIKSEVVPSNLRIGVVTVGLITSGCKAFLMITLPSLNEADAAQRAIKILHLIRDPEPVPVIKDVSLIEGRIYRVIVATFRYTGEHSRDMTVLISRDGVYERIIFDMGLPYPLDQLDEIDRVVSRCPGFDPIVDFISGYHRMSACQTLVSTVPKDRNSSGWNKDFTITLTDSRFVVSETLTEY